MARIKLNITPKPPWRQRLKEFSLRMLKESFELLIGLGAISTIIVGVFCGIAPALSMVSGFENITTWVDPHSTTTIVWWAGVLWSYLFFQILCYLDKESMNREFYTTAKRNKLTFFVSVFCVVLSWFAFFSIFFLAIWFEMKARKKRILLFEQKIKGTL